ncbi:MAG: hypothetical protein KF813_07380 [Trueperaceae bacterium]|nr:hypothetical protein [Trueperaceae bacterium]
MAAFSLAFTFVLVLAGCGGTPPTQQNTGILGPNTKLIAQAELAHLTAVTEAGVYSFGGSTPVLAGIEAGDVLLIEVSALTPTGGVLRVDQVETAGAGIDVHTTQATLEEAFRELRISGEYTSDAVTDSLLAVGAVTSPRPAQLDPAQVGITFPLDIQVGDSGANVRLQGSLGISPRVALNLDVDIFEFELEELSLEFGATESFEATLTGSGEFSFDEGLELVRIPFLTIFVPVYIPGIGIITIPVTPTVVVETGVKGSIRGQFQASGYQWASFTSKVGYVNGGWGATSDSSGGHNFEVPEASASVNVKAYAAARVIADIAGLGGPYARAEVYLGFNAVAESPPPCVRGVLEAGILGTAGAAFVGTDYDTVLFNKSTPLASFDTCDPNAPVPATVWARGFSRKDSVGENARAVVQAADGTYLVAGDSTLIDGVTGTAASAWALRLDALGNPLWQRAYYMFGAGRVVGALALNDGFILATTLGVMKLDPGGNVIWARRFESTQEIYSITERHGGGVVIAGRYGTSSQAWIAALDLQGWSVWSRTYGAESFNRVRQTSDGGYVAIGYSPIGAQDIKVTKVTGGGAVEWSTNINNIVDPTGGEVPNPSLVDSTDTGYDVIEKPGGSYVVVGETYGPFPIPEPAPGGYYAVFVAELDQGGDLTADPVVHRATADAYYSMGYAVALRTNGSSVIVGRFAQEATDLFVSEKVLLIQGSAYTVIDGPGTTSAMGGLLGGGNGSMPIAATADGGVIVVSTNNGPSGHDEMWVTKFGRTLYLDFGYIGNTSGQAYENENAVQSSTFLAGANAPLVINSYSPNVEVTGYFIKYFIE